MHVMDEEAVMCETNTRLHDAGVKKTRLLSGILGYENPRLRDADVNTVWNPRLYES